jgi:hypothetical protein
MRSKAQMKIRPAPLPEVLDSYEFVPQAVVNKPVRAFADLARIDVTRAAADPDEYEGIAFFLGQVPVTVMHYKGHPVSTSTIYLPQSVSSIREISRLLGLIFSQFALPPKDVAWQRKDRPEL